MLFENALYYPTIDIKDVAWLKSAVLLWDKISTIVPDSEREPYKNECSRAFASAGVIVPHKVNPYKVNFQGLDKEVRLFLASPEGKRSFLPRDRKRIKRQNAKDLLREFSNSEYLWNDYGGFKISAEKFGSNLNDVISEFVDDDGYLIASRAFMNFYMTSQANRICQAGSSKALLTDLTYTNDLTCAMMKYSPNQRMGEEMMEQGLMYKYIINGLSIDPNTPFDKILKFREKYKDERDLFKCEISSLIQNNNFEGLPASEIVNQIGRIYRMKVLPSEKQLKKALNGMKIDCWEAVGSNVVLTGVAALNPTGAGAISFSWKVIWDLGLSIWQNVISYRKDRRQVLTDSPYSYLFKAKRFRNTRR